MKIKSLLLALLISIVSIPAFASGFSFYVTPAYLFSYDTNVFSSPMVSYDTADWWSNRQSDPYIKRFNNGVYTSLDFYFSNTARTGISIGFNVAKPFKATQYNLLGNQGGSWEYVEEDVIDSQKLAMFFSLGPSFRVVLSDYFDMDLALRLSAGSYDYFDNNVILGVQADPSVKVYFAKNFYMTIGMHYDFSFLYLYINSTEVYKDNYIHLNVGGFAGIGVMLGEREVNV